MPRTRTSLSDSMAIITQTDDRSLQPFGTIEFDEFERNEYVSRFLRLIVSADEEASMAAKVFNVHQELSTRHDLYMAVWSKMDSRQRATIRSLIDDHRRVKPADGFCGKRTLDGDVCIMPIDHKGDCRTLPF